MALTHLSGLFVDPTLQPTVERTGSATCKVTGTTLISGEFSASASGKQTTLTKVAVTGTVQMSGAVTATGSGKTTTVGVLSVTGKSTLTQVVVSSAANAMCGIRGLVTAGTGKYSIATNKVRSSSRIFLQPMSFVANTRPKVACINTIASGVSFSFRQLISTTTGASGPVAWKIVQIA